VSIEAAVEEIRITSVPSAVTADRAALARLDILIGKLEDLNLHDVREVPLPLRFELVRALEGLLSQSLPVPESPSKALELCFAGQAKILRGLYPEFEDEFDDE
jgi:hypothetical protein